MKKVKIAPNIWEVSPDQKKGMKVPARIIASDKIIGGMDEGVVNQITNVASLPGICENAWCMPDGHWGYGFPIGGVAAFDLEEGIISPGGIGFDINCGVRLIKTDLTEDEVRPKLRELIENLFELIPSGVGKSGSVNLSKSEFEAVMVEGATWCKNHGFAWESDIEHIEQRGKLHGANPAAVSERAIKRGIDQIGTLGSGNHYIEIQSVEFDADYRPEEGRILGLVESGQICIMVHCGSRGFGDQIGTDYLQSFGAVMKKYGITTNDRELACAPFRSPEGQAYLGAMACAANAAFANRQVITDGIRRGFQKVFGKIPEMMGMNLIYDVAHNIAKIESHRIEGKPKQLLVHRKGATRAFGPGNFEVPADYRDIGQPVLVGGSMQSESYLMLGTKKAENLTFGSTIHGAGRALSRAAAKKKIRGSDLQNQMEKEGILVRTASYSGLAEEAGFAYKKISEVVESVEDVGISRKVVRLRPMANIKG